MEELHRGAALQNTRLNNTIIWPIKIVMMKAKTIAVISIVCASVAGSSVNAATIPAGTTLTVNTVSLITSKDAVGRSFEAKLAQDVSINGKVLLKAGTKAFGKIKTSRYNPRKNEPLTVELMSVSVNGRKVAVTTNTFQPGSSPVTARQAQYGHTAGTLVVNPGTKMQFQLLQPVTL
jgi:hypothetical protein